MMTKKKHKYSRGHRYDWGEVLQFMKDNPELMQMASSMMQSQQGGNQQPAQKPVDVGVTGQKQTWSGASMIPLSNEIASLANSVNTLSDKGKVPVEQAINLPSSYYANGGRLFDGGGSFFGADGGASGLSYASASIGGLTNTFNQWNGIDTSAYEEKVKNYGNRGIAASDNQELLNAWANKNYLNHINKYDITGGNLAGEIIGRQNQNVTAASQGFLSTGNWIGAVIGGVTDLVGQGFNIFNTAKKVKRLNRAIDVANARQDRAFTDAATNIQKNKQTDIMANYSAFGGPIYGMPVMGAASYDIAKDNAYAKQLQAQGKIGSTSYPAYGGVTEFAEGGGIHIAPSKKGTFTAAAKKHGKSVQAFASQVLAHPENYSPAMRKKANFARNASKWHHADGGFLMSDEFTNGVTMINQGGTHENNPHEGVQMGIAPDGKPNLVEEGEAIFDDYVFSNRLRVPKEVRNKYKLRGPKDMTFAEAFREAQKESQERPNDPISQDGIENIAMILARTQEAVRDYERNHKKARGGRLYDGDTNPYAVGSQEWFEWENNHPYTQAIESAPKGSYEATFGEVNPIDAAVAAEVIAENNEGKSKEKSPKQTNLSWLRYAEPLANAGAVFSDMIGLTNTPTVFDYIPGFQAVSYNPLGNYIPVTHFDTRYAANQAAQQAAATRNAIMQSSAPSRNATLLAADYNSQIANGELLRQAAMDDYNMMVRREEFNRATNQANSQMGLQAAMANQDARLRYAQAALQQAKMNEDNSNMASAAKAANISALAESLSGIGREQDATNWRDMLIRAGAFGTLSEKPTDWTDAEWKEYQKVINGKACGGKIKRRKKGLTY